MLKGILTLCLFLLLAPSALASDSDQQKVFFKQTEGEHAEVVPVVVRDGRTQEIGTSKQLHASDHAHLEAPKISKGEQLAYKARGQRGFMLVSIGWPGAPRTDIDPADYDSLGQWFSDASNGLWSWDPVTVLELDLPRQPACNDLAWASATRDKLRSLGYFLNRDYAALGLVVPEVVSGSCIGAAAYAYVGCFLNSGSPCGLSVYGSKPSFGLFGPSFDLLVHELGHTLGLRHANMLECRSQFTGAPGSFALDYRKDNCINNEYGDQYDVMGGWDGEVSGIFDVNSPPPYHSVFARSIGWMDSGWSRLLLNGGRNTIDLNPYASFTGTRAIEFRLPPEPRLGGFSPGKISMEYRSHVGLDSDLWKDSCADHPVLEQLLLRYFPSQIAAERLNLPFDLGRSYLLDTSPNTIRTCDEGLIEGERWSDPRGLVEVEHQGIYQGKARVAVRLPKITAAPLQWRVNRLDVAGRSFRARLVSDRYLRHISKRDFRFLRGRCRLSLSRSTLQVNKPLLIRLRSCRGRVVQLGLKSQAFLDEFSQRTPKRLLSSPRVRIRLGS